MYSVYSNFNVDYLDHKLTQVQVLNFSLLFIYIIIYLLSVWNEIQTSCS